MLEIILVCSLFAYGMYTLQRPGFLLSGLRTFWQTFPKALHEPLYDCGVCVSSIWGGMCYLYLTSVQTLFADDRQNRLLFYLPIVLIAMAGINAVIDRAVKAFEKTYGYKPPKPLLKGEDRWNYLLPYHELRRLLVERFVVDHSNRGHYVVEVGGHHEKWQSAPRYFHLDHHNKLDSRKAIEIMQTLKETNEKYVVVLMGLYFEGELRVLREFINRSEATLIEYSDDGISRQQVEQLTEGIKTKILIPEYTLHSSEQPPQSCGSIDKRKVIILQPR